MTIRMKKINDEDFNNNDFNDKNIKMIPTHHNNRMTIYLLNSHHSQNRNNLYCCSL